MLPLPDPACIHGTLGPGLHSEHGIIIRNICDVSESALGELNRLLQSKMDKRLFGLSNHQVQGQERFKSGFIQAQVLLCTLKIGDLPDGFDRSRNITPGIIERGGGEPECRTPLVLKMGEGYL